jgi:type I restriction enzyme M protein
MKTLFDLPLSKEDNLLKKFEEIHDYIYANDGLSPQQTLEEFVKILFIKIFDENKNLNQFSVSIEEWNSAKSGNASDSVLERISVLFDQTKVAYQDIFDTDDRIKISRGSLCFTINKLQHISLLNSSQDAKGLAFQKFLSHHEKDNRGQFFTPEPIMDFCVSMLQPKPGDMIIDPACGSGGFLMSALKYMQNTHKEINTKKLISENLFGLDINKSISRIAKMKLILESNNDTNIFCLNSLEDLDSLKFLLKNQEGFDIVLANPPFGAKITSSTILSGFDLGFKWKNHEDVYHKTKSVYPNQNAEILFIERCLQLLKEGGRMAIVLPNGNLENPSLEYLRYYIKLKAKIMAIVNLPEDAFIPFGTGVKTSVLFLEKETPNKIRQYPIFFGRIKKLGYQGNKNGTPVYRKNVQGHTIKDNNEEPVLDEDFSDVIKIFKNFQKEIKIENENAYSLDYDELNGRFDYDFYSPENRQLFSNLNNVKTVRLGDICDIVKIKSKKLKNPSLQVEYVELSDINTHAYEIINFTTYQVHELPSRASYEICEGDIITAIAGNSVGTRKHATALVSKEFEGSICTNGFRVLRNFKINSYYLLYFFKSEMFLKQMFMYRTGAAIPNISDTDLAAILIHLPDERKMELVSRKMENALRLRQESKKQIESISFDVA